MQGVPRIHYRPREAATYEAPLDILIPALMKLRECNDSLKALVLVDSLPDIILPALAYGSAEHSCCLSCSQATTDRSSHD